MAAATLKDQSLSDLMRKNNAYYVPTLSLLEDYISSLGKETLTAGKQNLKALSDQGVKIALGTDTFGDGKHRPRVTTRELELMADAGLSPEKIIRAATCDAAAYLGLLDCVGTVERKANMQICSLSRVIR